jgi:hypothetical protein
MRERFVDTVKSVVAVNLRYTSLLLGLSREYLKSFEGAVRDGIAGEPNGAGATPAPSAAPARRAPILLAGLLNEEVSGAFGLNNTSNRELNVALVVQGELDPKRMTIDPSTLLLVPGASEIVRLKLTIGPDLDEGRDYAGAVLAPGLSSQAVDFVVRRLSAAPRSRKKKAA